MNEREIIETLDNEPIIDWGVEAIKAPNVWSKTKGKGVKILLIDTGIDTDHPDLRHAFRIGYNFFERSNDVEDGEGHGSHIAGLLVGKATGVAPEAELHVVKVLNSMGRGTIASVMDGITYAIQNRFDIISMSLGMPYELPLIFKQKLVDAHNAGIVMVCATGNEGGNEPLYPAFMNEVIAVGGLDKDFNVAPFSNGGHDVLAPSVDIFSTYKDGNYARMTGTSMSTPLIAGIIALIISYAKSKGIIFSPKEIKSLLIENSVNYLPDIEKIFKRIDDIG